MATAGRGPDMVTRSSRTDAAASAYTTARSPSASRRTYGIGASRGPSGRGCVDLRGAALRQLLRGDVHAVDVSDRCTWADESDFYSYRRDVTHGGAPRTGQLAAVIAPRVEASRPSREGPS